MVFAKLKGIVFGLVVVVSAVTTGGIVLAQRPQKEQAKVAYDVTQTQSEPDRLHAVEQKLDRILEASAGLGQRRSQRPSAGRARIRQYRHGRDLHRRFISVFHRML